MTKINGFPPTKCARHGCNCQAQFIPVVNVPAKTILVMKDQEREIYRCHLNIPLCDKHSKSCNVNDFLSERLAKMFIGQAQSRRKPPPDLEGVYLTIESMSADGYQMILQQEAAKGKGGFVLQ